MLLTVFYRPAHAQCGNGAITETCFCGPIEYENGFCCEEIWFDAHYKNCPDRMFFVSTTGNDSNVGTLLNPWLTLGKASSELVAGDAVIVRSGEYSEPGSGLRFRPAITPENSGTEGHPVIFKSYPGETVDFINNGQGPLMGAAGKSYVIFDGFRVFEGDSYINDPDNYDTGAVTIIGSNNIVIKNCVIEGAYVATDNNHDGIRVEDSNHITLRNNIIRNVTGDSFNTSGIKLYLVTDSIFEHNEIYNTFSAIYPKGGDGNDRNTFRYNYIHDSGIGFTILNPGAQDWNNIYQNIVHNCTDLGGNSLTAFRISPAGSYGKDTKHFNIYNNTVHNCSKGIVVNLASFENTVEDLDFFNNIFSSVINPLELETNSSGILGNFFSDYNGFHDYVTFRIDYSNIGDMSEWINRTSQDSNSLDGVSPQFVNAAGGDFHLSDVSLMRNAGRDIQDHDGDEDVDEKIDLGAYISGDEIIGLNPYGLPEDINQDDIDEDDSDSDSDSDIYSSDDNPLGDDLQVSGGCGNILEGKKSFGFWILILFAIGLIYFFRKKYTYR